MPDERKKARTRKILYIVRAYFACILFGFNF